MTADYIAQLVALQPPGAALPTDADSTWGQLLAALADEPTRVDIRADALIRETDPRQATELLTDWEGVCGLPGACATGTGSLQERRAAVVATLTAVGGQTPAYYLRAAEELGYAITIDEFRPFVTGMSRCGDVLNGPHEVRHVWRVTVHGPRVTMFRTGASATGERLLDIADATELVCVLRRFMPAHTELIVAYEEAI